MRAGRRVEVPAVFTDADGSRVAGVVDITGAVQADDVAFGAPALSYAQATELTASLRRSLDHVDRLLVRAWGGRVWLALGLESWDQWLDRYLGGVRLVALPRLERRRVVLALSEIGMSKRGIARTIGSAVGTVTRDLQDGSAADPGSQVFKNEHLGEFPGVGVEHLVPSGWVRGRDGKLYRTPAAAPVADSVERMSAAVVAGVARLRSEWTGWVRSGELIAQRMARLEPGGHLVDVVGAEKVAEFAAGLRERAERARALARVLDDAAAALVVTSDEHLAAVGVVDVTATELV